MNKERNKNMLRKMRVIAIIALFIGLAFIPSFNAVSISMLENHPPEAPTIKGKILVEGGKTYNYKFKATDPDGDDVRYYINWNDGSFEWTDYYLSGFEIIVNHTFDKTQIAKVEARANDTHGALGPVGTIQWSKEDDCDCQSDDRPICKYLLNLQMKLEMKLRNVIR